MGFFDRLFGQPAQQPAQPPIPAYSRPPQGQPAYRGAPTPGAQPLSEDERAIARYRYLLRTAPPEAIEQAHAEAFAALTPEQRRQVLASLQAEAPANERPVSDDPASLARAATRQELRQPGSLERTFARPGMGFGTMLASSMLGTIAGVVIGTAIADMLTPDFPADANAADSAGDTGEGGADAGESGADTGEGGDWGGDSGSGGDWGGSGGDFGGGDFGGGDFGGGDFGGF